MSAIEKNNKDTNQVQVPEGARLLEILLVEDNVADIILTRTALRDSGILHHVEVAKDGKRAITFLKQCGKNGGPKRPDIVLLDLNMPKVNGFQVLSEMYNDSALQGIPVIVLSGSPPPVSSGAPIPKDMKAACAHHPITYLLKPVLLKEYLALIRVIREICMLVGGANGSADVRAAT